MQILNKTEYLDKHFKKDKEKYSSKNSLRTGFDSLDKHLTIRPGVYMCGGLPSVGKSTLFVQLADNFASLGNKVLFFSFEQTEYDLTVKSINRIKYQEKLNSKESIARYKQFADNITTVSDQMDATIDVVESTLNDYIKHHDVKPIVFIDYLQLIRPSGNASKREGIEQVSSTLVRLSKQYNITMFVLSSLNRMNYMSQIDFESFKESGSLEYDADVVLGLQYQMISNDKFISCSSIDKKRLMLSEEKDASVRKIELVCLKNRFGPIAPKCKLDYFTEADLFVETKPEPNKKCEGYNQIRSF